MCEVLDGPGWGGVGWGGVVDRVVVVRGYLQGTAVLLTEDCVLTGECVVVDRGTAGLLTGGCRVVDRGLWSCRQDAWCRGHGGGGGGEGGQGRRGGGWGGSEGISSVVKTASSLTRIKGQVVQTRSVGSSGTGDKRQRSRLVSEGNETRHFSAKQLDRCYSKNIIL